MKILIYLSNLLLGEALRELLSKELSGYQVMATDDSRMIDDFQPAKIFSDARNLTRILPMRSSDAKIVLIDTGLEEEQVINLLLSCRLDGVISPQTDVPLFRKALKAIDSGQVWIDNGKMRAILDHLGPLVKTHQEDTLSRKEQEIILLISQGLKNKEIAARLFISEQTVKTHISRIFKKARVSRRSQLVPLALKFQTPNTM